MTFEHSGTADRAERKPTDAQESRQEKFVAELATAPANGPDRADPTYRNGLASENLIAIEKWSDSAKQNGPINQDELSAKLSNFAVKSDKMWKAMEQDPQQLVKSWEDEGLTYNRFNMLMDQLDSAHWSKLFETLPWTLRPGE
jgi:hypothetical protein